MNLKASTRYQIWEYTKSVKIFYLVVVLVIGLFGILTRYTANSDFRSDGGVSTSTIIFLFVLGLNSFKETFLMSLQNGTSRRTMVTGRILSVGVVVVVMALMDKILSSLLKLVESDRFRVNGIYDMIFPKRASEVSSVVGVFESLLLMICLYVASAAAGYLITTAYYRMNKALKVIVSVGVPAGIFLVLPIVDMGLTHGRISLAIAKFIIFVTGVEKGHPYYLIVSSIVAAALFFGLSWVLIRRAVDRG